MKARDKQLETLKRVTKPRLKDLDEYLNERIETCLSYMESGTIEEFKVNQGRLKELRHILSDIKAIQSD